MADFPDLVQLYGSQFVSSDGFKVTRSVSGVPKIRSYYTTTSNQIKLQLYLDEAGNGDKTTLEDFYNTNKKLEFNFLWKADNVTYTCRFTKAIQYKIQQGGHWVATVQMETV